MVGVSLIDLTKESCLQTSPWSMRRLVAFSFPLMVEC